VASTASMGEGSSKKKTAAEFGKRGRVHRGPLWKAMSRNVIRAKGVRTAALSSPGADVALVQKVRREEKKRRVQRNSRPSPDRAHRHLWFAGGQRKKKVEVPNREKRGKKSNLFVAANSQRRYVRGGLLQGDKYLDVRAANREKRRERSTHRPRYQSERQSGKDNTEALLGGSRT